MRISDWSSDVCSSDLMLPPAGARFIVAESGANDPEFNLRREPALIQRVEGAADATFVSLLEPHGAYDASSEAVVARSEEHTSELQSLMRISYAVFCLKKQSIKSHLT